MSILLDQSKKSFQPWQLVTVIDKDNRYNKYISKTLLDVAWAKFTVEALKIKIQITFDLKNKYVLLSSNWHSYLLSFCCVIDDVMNAKRGEVKFS